MVTVGGSLCVVLGVFLVVVWCTKRFAPPGSSALPKEAIESLGRAPLTARQQMQLIRVGNKLLLVALTPAGVEPLTEVTDATEVEHLLGLCRRGQKGSSTEVFRQTLAQLAEEPAPRGFVGISTTNSRGGR
jgi:flagellar biogenesis protein FliO